MLVRRKKTDHLYSRWKWINMSSSLRKQIPTLSFLTTAKPAVVKTIIKNGDDCLIKAICECCKNLLNGNIKLTKHQKSRLQPYKQQLRALADRKISRKKKKVILQHGGMFMTGVLPLLKAVIPVASAVLASGVLKKKGGSGWKFPLSR